MRKETMERRLDKLNRWIEDLVEASDARHIPRGEVRVLMENQMGWIDPRTQDRWIAILVRRKNLIPLDVQETVFYVPEERYRRQKALRSFDIPEIQLEVDK